MIGEVIGNYRLVAELGRGGMGVVYRADHVQLGKPAAVKMLLPALSSDAAIVQRFFNEARAASAIDHPGIVEVHDFGHHTDGAAYIVMALLKGESLEHRLQRGALDPLEGASIVAQIASALTAAHVRGIIHRDLKPDNIFLVPNELVPFGIQVKLLDFGIAKLADDQTSGVKTQTGSMIGTPAYMSPEQCMGRSDLDHRTDLYAVGCILFHILCGRTPFARDQGTGMMIAAHLRDPAPDPRRFAPHTPELLATITLRLLEKEPAARYQSAAELRAALVEAGAQAPVTLRSGPSDAPGALPVGHRHTGPEAFGATTAPTSDVPLGAMSAAGAAYVPSGHVPRGAGVAPTMMAGDGETTASGSAAQLVARPRARTVGTWVVVAGLLAAIGGVGLVVATRSGDAPTTTPATTPATPTEATSNVPVASAPAVAVSDPPAAVLDEPVCTDGRSRRPDTHGECCWPGQAWSIERTQCVGTPICPTGLIVKAEQCEENARPRVATARHGVKPPDDDDGGGDGPARGVFGPVKFTLDATRYVPGDTIKIRFASPIASRTPRQAWVTVTAKGATPSTFGPWGFVKDGGRSATLEAPSKLGAYEVRLHTEYPTRSNNLVGTVSLVVGPPSERAEPPPPPPPAKDAPTPRAQQRFTVATRTLTAGSDVELRFPVAMRALPLEQFWVTIVKAGAADAAWGVYAYVGAAASGARLKVPAEAGAYELRLHANYPAKTTNVVHRVAVQVE